MMKSLKSPKNYLKVLTALGVVALLGGGAGTFATFNATTTNPGNTFTTGTLVLSNKVNSGTACLSTAAGITDTNVNANCDTFFAASLHKPGDTASGNLTLKNEGSLSAAGLTLQATSCADAIDNATYHGSGSLCGALKFYVQEWSDSGFITPSKCWYGGSADSGVTCDATFATSPASLSGFGTSAVDISGTPPALAAGASRYFTIGVGLPSTAGNTYQGLKASFDLTWQETQ